MATWTRKAANILLKIGKKDQFLMMEIRKAIKQIEKDPIGMGNLAIAGVYFYVDSDDRFRITYGYHPKGEVEVVAINVI